MTVRELREILGKIEDQGLEVATFNGEFGVGVVFSEISIMTGYLPSYRVSHGEFENLELQKRVAITPSQSRLKPGNRHSFLLLG